MVTGAWGAGAAAAARSVALARRCYSSAAAAGGAGGEALQRAFEGLACSVQPAGPGAGRGLFADAPLPAGQELFSEPPLVAHPTMGNVLKGCYGCLRRLPFPQAEERDTFCSPACKTDSHKAFYRLEGAVGFAALKERCRENGARFPLLAARLACMSLMGSAEPDALAPLCFANVPPPFPPEWVQEHALLVKPLEGAGLGAAAGEALPVEWYAGVMARLHLNAFRVDLPVANPGDWEAALSAAILEGGGGGGATASAGTAVYLRGSLFNHSCEPNVEVSWLSEDATATFSTRREIQAGEELTITYIDSSMSTAKRREDLHWNYGFTCQCSMCTGGG